MPEVGVLVITFKLSDFSTCRINLDRIFKGAIVLEVLNPGLRSHILTQADVSTLCMLSLADPMINYSVKTKFFLFHKF
jgi:hypothetical protein